MRAKYKCTTINTEGKYVSNIVNWIPFYKYPGVVLPGPYVRFIFNFLKSLPSIMFLLCSNSSKHSCTFFFAFGDRVALYSPGCPGTHFVEQAELKLRNLPASATQVLGYYFLCKFYFWIYNKDMAKKKDSKHVLGWALCVPGGSCFRQLLQWKWWSHFCA